MELNIGNKAPTFVGKDQNGNSIQLLNYQGKKVVLYFYPKDNTPGCTAQSCNLRDNYNLLLKKGYIVLGISTDNEKSHQKFIDKFNLPFPLIADTDKSIHKLFGAWQEKKLFGKKYMGTVRITYIINEKGYIDDIIKNVKTKNHTAQIINL